MDKTTKRNLANESTWLRLVYMLVLAVAFNIIEFIVFAVAVFQFVAKLVTGKANDRLGAFGGGLAHYARQIVAYVTFETDAKPFPFAQWGDVEGGDHAVVSDPEPQPETAEAPAPAAKPKPRKRAKKPAAKKPAKPPATEDEPPAT